MGKILAKLDGVLDAELDKMEKVFDGARPQHAPVRSSQQEIAQLQAKQAELQRLLAEMQKKKKKRPTPYSVPEHALRAQEEDLRQRHEAASREAAEQQRRDEEARNYPVPDFLEQSGHEGMVNIAVVGNADVGKSLFVNVVRRVERGHETWAPVGVTETTKEPTMYVFPDEPRARIWDIPGAGTKQFPRESYIETLGLRYFDMCIVMTAGRFTETEIMLLNEFRQFNVPFFTVRSKIDFDIENNEADKGMSEDETKSEITTDLRDRRGIADPYLISNRKIDGHDFPKLRRDVRAAIIAHRKY